MSGYRVLGLAVCLMLAGIATAADDWHKVATLTASGKAKEVPVNREISSVRLHGRQRHCRPQHGGRSGGRQGHRHTASRSSSTRRSSRDYELGAKLHVTGLRISDSDKGTYTVYVK